jgi:hypothetical protein
MSLDPDTTVPKPGDVAADNASLLLAPVAFLLNLGLAYALVDVACVSGTRWALHLLHAICLLLALAGGYVAAGVLRRSDRDTAAGSRRHVIGLAGLLASGLFALVILAQWLPEFFVDPCR